MKSLKAAPKKLELQKKTIYNFHLAKEQMKQVAGGLEQEDAAFTSIFHCSRRNTCHCSEAIVCNMPGDLTL